MDITYKVVRKQNGRFYSCVLNSETLNHHYKNLVDTILRKEYKLHEMTWDLRNRGIYCFESIEYAFRCMAIEPNIQCYMEDFAILKCLAGTPQKAVRAHIEDIMAHIKNGLSISDCFPFTVPRGTKCYNLVIPIEEVISWKEAPK